MRAYFDLDRKLLIAEPGGTRVKQISHVRGDAEVFEVGFLRDDEIVELNGTFAMAYVIKQTPGDGVPALALATAFELVGDFYRSPLDLTGGALNALVGTNKSISLLCELTFTDEDGGPTTSQLVTCVVGGDLYRGDEPPPESGGTPTPWLVAQLNGAAAKVVPVDADSLPLNDSAAGGALKKLTFGNLKAWIQGFFAIVNNLTSSDADKALSANMGKVLEENKVGAMIDLDEAPTFTIVKVEILGTIYPEVRGELLNAGPGVFGVDYSDTDGRDAFTRDGTFNNGSVYHPHLAYDAGGAQKYRIRITIGGIGRVWTSNSADPDIRNIKTWVWTEGTPGDGIPTFIVTFATTAPGVAGQRYRFEIADGFFEHFVKQADNSILSLGVFDAFGNQYPSAYLPRVVTEEEIATDAPGIGELVIMPSRNNCTAVGKSAGGFRTPLLDLEWQGIDRLIIDQERADELYDEANTRISYQTGASRLHIEVTEDLTGLTPNFIISKEVDFLSIIMRVTLTDYAANPFRYLKSGASDDLGFYEPDRTLLAGGYGAPSWAAFGVAGSMLRMWGDTVIASNGTTFEVAV